MQLDRALPDAVSLFHDDFEWIQPLDYEHVPFHCRRCHAHGHLFRDCPLVAQSKPQNVEDKEDAEGFTKVSSRRRNHKKAPQPSSKPSQTQSIPTTSNSFAALATNDPPSENTTTNPVSSTPSIPSSSKIHSVVSGPSHASQPSDDPPNSDPLAKLKQVPWNPNNMDLDTNSANPSLASKETQESLQTTLMEEDSEGFDVGDLDIIGLEDACKKK